MFGSVAGAKALTEAVDSAILRNRTLLDTCEFLLCPPAVHIQVVKQMIDHNHAPVAVGAQDCAPRQEGAFTGDISAPMLKDLGCKYVILGHSERRSHHHETDADIAVKAEAAHQAGLITIICLGETESQRAGGQQEGTVAVQLLESLPPTATSRNTVIAYEPVWAIGTGKTATPDDVEAMHGFIRRKLEEKLAENANMRILYGGSVKPDNAAGLLNLENVDGALIGGASLKADDYIAIAASVRGHKRRV